MTFAPFNSHTNEIFINLNLLKVRDLISLSQLKLAHNFLNDRLPTDLMSLFLLRSDVEPTFRTMKSKTNRLFHLLLTQSHMVRILLVINVQSYGMKNSSLGY